MRYLLKCRNENARSSFFSALPYPPMVFFFRPLSCFPSRPICVAQDFRPVLSPTFFCRTCIRSAPIRGGVFRLSKRSGCSHFFTKIFSGPSTFSVAALLDLAPRRPVSLPFVLSSPCSVCPSLESWPSFFSVFVHATFFFKGAEVFRRFAT